ncbi:MAG TPA: hypothetical protein VK893_05640, partial [Pyrinomonadaceae bacterium]|nr:hypothetical protein [Pyrinomonadaceae bacterium]
MSNSPKIAPYGSWKSPITSDLIVSGSVGLSQPTFDGNQIHWIEMRPKEGGRNVIVRRETDGAQTVVTPQPFNARTRVHEYGGGDYLAFGGTVCFSNFSDQRVYRQDGLSEPRAITPAADVRYADYCLDETRGRLICVREDHRNAGV